MENIVNLVIIIGPSCVGKTSVAKMLCDEWQFNLIPSVTTRNRRDDDINYGYVDKITFERMIDNGEFMDYSIENNNYYGITKNSIQSNAIIITNIKGAKNFKMKFPKAVVIFLAPKNIDELMNRIKHSNRLNVEERMDSVKKDLGYKNEFDLLIENDSVDGMFKNIMKQLIIK